MPRTEVLVLTMHHSRSSRATSFRPALRGTILKSDADESLIAAVESLRMHKPFLTSKVTEFVLDDYLPPCRERERRDAARR